MGNQIRDYKPEMLSGVPNSQNGVRNPKTVFGFKTKNRICNFELCREIITSIRQQLKGRAKKQSGGINAGIDFQKTRVGIKFRKSDSKYSGMDFEFMKSYPGSTVNTALRVGCSRYSLRE